jgi:hypothetical protein
MKLTLASDSNHFDPFLYSRLPTMSFILSTKHLATFQSSLDGNLLHDSGDISTFWPFIQLIDVGFEIRGRNAYMKCIYCFHRRQNALRRKMVELLRFSPKNCTLFEAFVHVIHF